jgi:murein DD-endopeptidase MepM/ murein hydrolase activator NlpD
MNYHYGSSMHKGASVNRSMKYAVDVTKLSMWGNDANGILPRDNTKYAIFNQVLYSPCDGEVFDVVDQWDNNLPFGEKAPYNDGNHIVIKTSNFYVLMGHLQKGSITVKVGDQVKQGQPIAKAGNSGWTLQPHTHIQAMKLSPGSFWAAEGLPIYFDGKNTVKNTLFFKTK